MKKALPVRHTGWKKFVQIVKLLHDRSHGVLYFLFSLSFSCPLYFSLKIIVYKDRPRASRITTKFLPLSFYILYFIQTYYINLFTFLISLFSQYVLEKEYCIIIKKYHSDHFGLSIIKIIVLLNMEKRDIFLEKNPFLRTTCKIFKKKKKE